MKKVWFITICLWCASVFCFLNLHYTVIALNDVGMVNFRLFSAVSNIDREIEDIKKKNMPSLEDRLDSLQEQRTVILEKITASKSIELAKKVKINRILFFAIFAFAASFTIYNLKKLFYNTPIAIKEYISTKIPKTQICPYCAEKIKAKAIVCKHCGRDLLQSNATK